jgi:hypothetical protein
LKTNKKAFVKGFGEVLSHSGTIAFSFAEMEEKNQIFYNSTREHAFTVPPPGKDVIFVRSPKGLYYFNPPYNKNQQACAANVPMDSVQENVKIFTNCQIERAKFTRKICHALDTPSLNKFRLVVTAKLSLIIL